MKIWFILLVSVSIAMASQTNPTRDELLQTVEHIQRLAKEQQVELEAAKADKASALKDLGTAQGQLVDLQGEVNKLAQHDANETAAKKHILTKYHRLKGIAMVIASACAVFLINRLTSFIPLAIMPYKIYLYAGAGTAAAAAVAIFL